MTVTDGRLNKLYPALTAKERALLILRAWKDGKDEDRMVRLTMPERQAREFNRYIDLMNGAQRLAPYIIGLKAFTDHLGLRFAWLLTLDLWALQVQRLGAYIWLHAKEPITESEYRRLTEQASSEMVPVDELAEQLTERYEGWAEDDFEEQADSDEPVVSDEAWERVKRGERDKLARLVGEGALAGRSLGRRHERERTRSWRRRA